MSSKKRELNRATEPPVILAVPWLTVVRPGRPGRFLCCSQKVWGVWTHWNPKVGKTIECTTPEKLCAGHALNLPRRWKGVITVIAGLKEDVTLLDIPPETGAKLDELAEGGSLRGKILLFQRQTANIRSRLLVEVVRDYDGETPIPAEVDPTPTLMKIWGIS